MKSRLLSAVLLAVVAMMVASAAFAAPAAATGVPFKGTIKAVETNDAQFPTLYVDAAGSGNATHLGGYTVSYRVVVNIPTLSGNETLQFVAANGDVLTAEGFVQATPTGIPDQITIVEEYTIAGGTGRFAGATGSFTMNRLLDGATQATAVTSGTFDGTIVLQRGD
jgi:hypothetical protein